MLSRWSALLFTMSALVSSTAFAAGSDYAEAMRVRALLSLPTPAVVHSPETEELRLPVSRGFDQGGTELCWAYAMLNGLETTYRVRHEGADLELSRRAMQYYTMENRHLLRIRGEASYIGERGVAVDAMSMVSDQGLVAFADFADIDDAYGDFDIRSAVDRAGTEAAKVAALHEGLAVVYGVPPAVTHLGDAELAPLELTAAIVAGTTWESYAISRDGTEGYRRHPDPDARPGVVSWFMPQARFEARIKAALAAGFPVEITVGGHCLLIYGARYDAAGSARSYFIKDSYPGYFYEADPRETMANLVEMTTAVL